MMRSLYGLLYLTLLWLHPSRAMSPRVPDSSPPPMGSPERPIPPMASPNPVPTDGFPVMPDGLPVPIAKSGDQLLPPDYYPMDPDLSMLNASRAGNFSVVSLPGPEMAYCDMLLELPVPPPASQVPWFCVCSQCKGGVLGPKGATGDRGLTGFPGSPGRRGAPGFRGQPGFMGYQGLKGQKGDDGMKGDQGDPGPLGMKGDHGMKGDKGHQGSDGPQGELGPQGEPGVCPERCDFFRGLPGHSGMPGPSGLRGLPGTQGEPGPKGEKGDLGHIGLPGGRGADGPKGDRGAQGECHCQDGAKGSDGQVGNPGLKGDLGQTGPQGTTGTMGRKGEKGEGGTMGEPGPCSPAIQSAFSATLGSSNPSSDMPVPFNRIVYNIQQNYNPNGIYTAPINGTYIFSYNLAINSKPLKVGLFQNFLPIVRSTAMTLGSTTNQQVVLHLKMGDMVWIQVKDNQYNGIYTSSECNSIFSGLLLYPDSCNMIMSREFPEPGSGIFSWGPEEDPTDVVEMTVP